MYKTKKKYSLFKNITPMKKYGILAFAAIFVFSMSTLAQQPSEENPENSPKRKHSQRIEMVKNRLTPNERAAKIAEVLKLTPSEAQKIQTLFEKQATEMEKMKTEHQKIMETEKARMEKMRDTHQSELEKIIGKEKMEQLEQIRQQKIEKKKHQMNYKTKKRGEKIRKFRNNNEEKELQLDNSSKK